LQSVSPFNKVIINITHWCMVNSALWVELDNQVYIPREGNCKLWVWTISGLPRGSWNWKCWQWNLEN